MSTTTKPVMGSSNLIILVNPMKGGFRILEATYTGQPGQHWTTYFGPLDDANVAGWQALTTIRAGWTT